MPHERPRYEVRLDDQRECVLVWTYPVCDPEVKESMRVRELYPDYPLICGKCGHAYLIRADEYSDIVRKCRRLAAAVAQPRE